MVSSLFWLALSVLGFSVGVSCVGVMIWHWFSLVFLAIDWSWFSHFVCRLWRILCLVVLFVLSVCFEISFSFSVLLVAIDDIPALFL